MASLKCMFCGYGIHYHGEPEGTEPVEHYFCDMDKWHEFEKENLPAGSIEIEYDYPLIESWRCARCGSFSFFSDYVHISGLYTPKEKISSEPMKEPFEFGPFRDDFQWFDITGDVNIRVSEVLTKYPKTHWLANWDDIEFFYNKIYYNFMRESDGSINIWRGHDYVKSVYSAKTTDVEDIINAKFFDDKKSIAEAQAEIEL